MPSGVRRAGRLPFALHDHGHFAGLPCRHTAQIFHPACNIADGAGLPVAPIGWRLGLARLNLAFAWHFCGNGADRSWRLRRGELVGFGFSGFQLR
jgi:hypothetical protein